jgi:hypothetical protein
VSQAELFYRSLDDELARTVAGNVGFQEKVQVRPVAMATGTYAARREQLASIRIFFEKTLEVFRAVLAGELSPLLRRLLLSDVPDGYGVDFHRGLPPEAFTTPLFFRTDESKSGKIFELQCPGSGWGDLELLRSGYAKVDEAPGVHAYKPVEAFTLQVQSLLAQESPAILHLLDNASNPASMRYLIARSQPPLRYWGYDGSVRNGDCGFIRSHSFFGLVSENLFRERLRQVAAGTARFDFPPLIVFDQKMPLCLPFFDETREFYSDSIREMLTYSHPVLETGFRDVDGSWTDIDSFIKRPRAARRYFLKYAGCDVAINWGSRAVYRLCDDDYRERLARAVADAKQGKFWLIQPEIREREWVTYFGKSDPSHTELPVVRKQMHVKYSCFYGPTDLIGIRSMHRGHFKVHGQIDTVVGVVIPAYADKDADTAA